MPNGAPTTPSNGYLTIKDTIIPKILTNMIINKRPIITWLLDNSSDAIPADVVVSPTFVNDNAKYLYERLNALAEIKKLKPNWGLPELVMPSFEKVMETRVRQNLS